MHILASIFHHVPDAMSVSPVAVADPVLAVGTLPFFIMISVVAAFLAFCMDREWGVGATTTVLVASWLMCKFGDVNVFAWAMEDKPRFLAYCSVYVGLGVGWSFLKWMMWGRERAATVNEFKRDWVASNPRPSFDKIILTSYESEGLSEDALESAKYDKLNASLQMYQQMYMHAIERAGYTELTRKGDKTTVPQFFQNHKRRVTIWASYWPVSLAWTLARDVVTETFKSTISLLGSRYQSIMNKIHKDTDTVA